ncbi:unnamed protein product [Caenorhabditis nigoni]
MIRPVLRAPMNTTIGGRFKLTVRTGDWLQEEAYFGNDMEHGYNVVVKGRLVDDPRTDVEKRFLEEYGGSNGIPRYLGSFELYDGEQQYIAHTRNGQKLETLFNLSTFKISQANAVRLGFQLFEMVHAMHTRGYLHRDIRPHIIMADIGWTGKLELELSSFGYVAPINPPPAPPADPFNGMKIGRYASYPAVIGEPYVKEDDYISIIFIMLASQGVMPFSLNTNRQWSLAEKKEQFDENPRRFVTAETIWLADMYWAVEIMRQEGTFSHDEVIRMLENAVEGVDMRSEISYAHNADGHFYIQ